MSTASQDIWRLRDGAARTSCEDRDFYHLQGVTASETDRRRQSGNSSDHQQSKAAEKIGGFFPVPHRPGLSARPGDLTLAAKPARRPGESANGAVRSFEVEFPTVTALAYDRPISPRDVPRISRCARAWSACWLAPIVGNRCPSLRARRIWLPARCGRFHIGCNARRILLARGFRRRIALRS